MIEIWKDIPNYEGIYQVSNLGNVKSLSRENYSGKGMKISKESLLDVSDTESKDIDESVQEKMDDLEQLQDMVEKEQEGLPSEYEDRTGIPEDEDESDLSPETIESIRRAEEYATSMKDDESDEGSEAENEPVTVGEDLPESALGLEDIEGAPSALKKEFSDMKTSIEATSQEQMERLDNLEKSVKEEQLKKQGIVIEDSSEQQDKEGEKSILIVDDDGKGEVGEEDGDQEEVKIKPIIIK